MQAKMAHADKAIRQDMGEEATDELEDGQGHDFLCALVAIVAVGKGDGIFAHSEEAVIGDGNAEDVTPEILDQFLRAIKWGLDEDFPIFGEGLLDHGGNIEGTWMGIEFAICPQLGKGEAETVAELVGK